MESRYYEVRITKTGRDIGSDDDFSVFDYQEKTFGKKEEVAHFLKEAYGTCERSEIYVDNKDPKKIEQTGWSYHFKDADWSHAPVEEWEEEDWVEVYEVVATPVLI